jgi:ferredoxin
VSKLQASVSGNVPGRFRVLTTDCICCSVCSDIAPEHFRESDGATHNIVYRQPATAHDVALCREALESCPVETIVDGFATAGGPESERLAQLSIASTACASRSSSVA